MNEASGPVVGATGPGSFARRDSRSLGNRQAIASGLSIEWQGVEPTVPEASLVRGVRLSIKRLMDILLGVLALIALGPLLLLTAFAIKLTSKGPVLYRQTRVGYQGKPFTIFKFRSMYLDQCDDGTMVQAVEGDGRVTPIGRFLRRTNIDELPQLLNVLNGDMSIVGPRPYANGMLAAGRPYEEITPYYNLRFLMKPGLTGWAQANGYRGPTISYDLAIRRLTHDIAYVQRFTLWLDVKIVVLTVWRELSGGSGF